MQVLAVRVVRHTRNFDKMLAFYRDVLEMRSISSWTHPDNAGALLSPGKGVGQMAVEILDYKGRPFRTSAPSNVDLSLEVRDVDAWHDRLRKQGIPIVAELEDKPWGHRAFSVEDPDGMRVTIYEVC
ncbi:MAG: VOC family protein [Anaerolineae bacterium]|nr:VOC family protein [Anaerolineae bacterium]